MQTKIHGLNSKLLTVKTIKNVNSYNLGALDSNFGDNEKIVGIAFRYNQGSASLAYKSINDRPLINASETRKGYINLVENNSNNTSILNNHNLWLMVSKNQNSYGFFIPPCKIKWTQSSIEFAEDLNLNGTKDLEFNVYYLTDCSKSIEPNILLDNGLKYNAVRKKTIQINASADTDSFAIKSNPINSCNTIIGLSYNEFNFETTDGRTNVSKGSISLGIPAALGASFLTMQVGSLNILDEFPITELKALPFLGFPYFPIEPTVSKNFNWNKCKISLPSKAFTQDNTCYLLTIYYV